MQSRFNDQVSSIEEGLSFPVAQDIYGVRWRDKPDQRIKKILLKAKVTHDEFLEADRKIAERDWHGLKEHLIAISHSKEGESKVRVEEAIDITLEAIKERTDFDR